MDDFSNIIEIISDRRKRRELKVDGQEQDVEEDEEFFDNDKEDMREGTNRMEKNSINKLLLGKRTTLATNKGSMNSQICDIESPISPSVAVPPPPAPSTGHRRLPQLPTGAFQLLDEEHRLCFGMARLETELDWTKFEEGRALVYGQDDSSGVSSCTVSEHVYPTHRVQTAFVPRHHDEVLLDVGDPVYVDRQYQDHWCIGTNLRTNQTGIFPSVYVFEIDILNDLWLDPTNLDLCKNERDTFYLTMLGSVEVAHHKGNDVLIQAINKVLTIYQNKEDIIVPQSVLMDISFRGVHLIDKKNHTKFHSPKFDYFYTLQNISFCGAHPKQLRYFSFITKHPLLPRFACHVFMSQKSTQSIVDAIGRAFKRSYDEYMAFAHPTDDIFLE